MNRLTLSFIPYSEIETLKSGERIKKLLNIILSNRIIVLQGRLKPEEEARLIEDTMALVGHIRNFKGVELAVVTGSQTNIPFMSKLRRGIANALVGQRDALTIIGPATIVKEIKRDPRKIDIMMKG